ncbi:MAG TPA: YihY/virulence factor BrkB family protein, partial [Armatimonadota bacterium]|nr:YihY/virulence factor BrkB family protein [Armatimonadota bacterium]
TASYQWLHLLARQLAGEAADQVMHHVDGLLANPGSHVAGFGVLVLIWASLRLFDTVERSLYLIWPGRRSRGLIKQKLVSLAMMLLAGVLLGTFVLLYLFIGMARQWLVQVAGVNAQEVELIQPRALLLAQFLVAGLAFTLVYKFVPGRGVRTRAAIRSGVSASVLWLIASPLFTWMMTRSQANNAMYGGLAGVVIFGLWAFLGARILMFGAHFTVAYEHVFVHARPPEEDRALIERTHRRVEHAEQAEQAD